MAAIQSNHRQLSRKRHNLQPVMFVFCADEARLADSRWSHSPGARRQSNMAGARRHAETASVHGNATLPYSR
ncbi:unnamed protein product [Boreogadus saida]